MLVTAMAGAQPAPDYIKITPPPGMRLKTLDQSGITGDITFVDKDGNTWLRKSAAATFARSFVLVQLVGDSGGTNQWMDLVENLPCDCACDVHAVRGGVGAISVVIGDAHERVDAFGEICGRKSRPKHNEHRVVDSQMTAIHT